MFALLILSLIQGFTEFLPVSSSGHLILIPYLVGWQDQGLDVDVALHAGTLLAVIIYFWRDIYLMLTSLWRWQLHKERYLAVCLIVATLPAVVVGLIFSSITTFRSPLLISWMAIVFGVLLYAGDWWGNLRGQQRNEVKLRDAIIIGLAQGLALIPGVSRSGICMTAARFLGIERQMAARFAFLLAIPTILGAVVLTSYKMYRNGTPLDLGLLSCGVALSFAFGLLAIHGMLRFLQRFSLLPFAIYRVGLGLLIMALL
ncbi:MAG: undecaprenyl-diphosphate phosphatase [Alphaproteobacteria bacterium]